MKKLLTAKIAKNRRKGRQEEILSPLTDSGSHCDLRVIFLAHFAVKSSSIQ
jgi:hypothetical protein